ncbi:MAG: acetylxylan esterase [Planctomycetaceae bacterium]
MVRSVRVSKSILLLLMLMLGGLATGGVTLTADEPVPSPTAQGDRLIRDYFRIETERVADNCLKEVNSKEDWEAQRGEARRQLFEMLGLDPLPERTPLNAVVTGTIEHDEFRVENVQFQSSPGLYVTGNLYLPKTEGKPRPAILYVCGHGGVFKDGVSYGNKTHYQHHGEWYARHGYVCLAIDTIQLGEIQGIHHGTHRLGMWWWHSRGYTPAGVEAWNGIRALDYLESRPEVDAKRLGVTGRSGGGAYSWWVAALDDRVQAAVPVAGITSMRNHVVDDCITGHCDCMFMVNTYEWDFAKLAALMAPRPLLISNTDKDGIFPLDGVYDVYAKTRRIYDLYGARDKLGLQITEGGHADTQELHIHSFVWFDRFLGGERRVIDKPAEKFFTPEQLKVFKELPSDERVTTVQEWFVPKSVEPVVAGNNAEWSKLSQHWMEMLSTRVFRAWPDARGEVAPLAIKEAFRHTQDGIQVTAYDFVSQEPYTLRVYLAHREKEPVEKLKGVGLIVMDQTEWESFAKMVGPMLGKKDESLVSTGDDGTQWNALKQQLSDSSGGVAWVAPRGVGPTEWTRDEKQRTHILRRFALLGQTADGMRVWDVRRAMQAVRQMPGLESTPLHLQGSRDAGVWALYASLYESPVASIDLWGLPESHTQGPALLNVLRFLDIPQTLALATARTNIHLHNSKPMSNADVWKYPLDTAASLNWPTRLSGVPVE